MLVDLVFQVCWVVINVVRTCVSELFWQVYMLFITWWYLLRLENYTSLKYGTDQSSIAATRLTTSWLTKPRFFPDAA